MEDECSASKYLVVESLFKKKNPPSQSQSMIPEIQVEHTYLHTYTQTHKQDKRDPKIKREQRKLKIKK